MGQVQNQKTMAVTQPSINAVSKPGLGVRLASWADKHSGIAKVLKWGTPLVTGAAGALAHFSICGWTLSYALVSLCAMTGGALAIGLLTALTVSGFVKSADKKSLEQTMIEVLQLSPEISADEQSPLRQRVGHLLAKKMAESTDRLYPGEFLEGGQYQVTRQLGEGAMGTTYLAEEFWSGEKARDVVIKRVIIDSDTKRNPIRIAGLLRECQVLAKVNHPNVVEIFNFLEDCKGALAFVMRQLKGVELTQKINSGEIYPVMAVDIALQLSKGLEEIHGLGIIHRDLKPDNVMVLTEKGKEWNVVIFDFGVSKHEEDTKKTITTADEIFGTPEYMSTEQSCAQTELISWKSDMYALGAILWQMLTCAIPFLGEKKRSDYKKIIEMVNDIVTNPLQKFELPNRVWDRELDKELDKDIAGHLYQGLEMPTRRAFIQYVLGRMMAKNPQDRYGGFETGPKVIKPANFSDFGEMLQGLMWDALKEAGYIREVQNRYGETSGIISDKFTGKREEFKLHMTLDPEDEAKLFEKLQQAPNRVILEYEKGKHDYDELRRDLQIIRAVFERITSGTQAVL